MHHNSIVTKEILVYTLLTGLIICGLASATITAPKVVHFGINFPFSNIVFSIFTYPIVDCICELWGKRSARHTVWIGLSSQILFTFLIQLSIHAPPAPFWQLQPFYQTVLNTSGLVVIASLIAFTVSQLLDISIFQWVKEKSKGKWLWLRTNVSTYVGQIIDSSIFVTIVFYHSNHKLEILWGSIVVKIILSLLTTPFVYLIVISVNRYLKSNTLAFKDEKDD